MDLDDLFGGGVDLGDGVVAKAQVRFRIQPPEHPVAQDIVDRVVAAYDERVGMICDDIDEVLRHVDPRRSVSLVLAIGAKAVDLVKGNVVTTPGKRGGQWWRDANGKIRYGEEPTHRTAKPMDSAAVSQHVGHFRPSAFMGRFGADSDVTDYLQANGKKLGFGPGALSFLNSWYGTDQRTGPLLDAFLDCAGLTRDDLRDDLSKLKFGTAQVSFEEAVFQFFAAQATAFMGKEPSTPEESAAWEQMLNDEIKPALDGVFQQYEGAKADEGFQDAYVRAPDISRRRFFGRARDTAGSTKQIADRIVSDHDVDRQLTDVVAGIGALGLFDRRKDVLAPDERLLIDHPGKNPLLASGDRLDKLTPSQLMLLYVAAELCHRWDPDAQVYSTEPQREAKPGPLARAAYDSLSRKWGDTAALVHTNIHDAVDRVVAALNDANAGRDTHLREFASDGHAVLTDARRATSLRKRRRRAISLRKRRRRALSKEAGR